MSMPIFAVTKRMISRSVLHSYRGSSAFWVNVGYGTEHTGSKSCTSNEWGTGKRMSAHCAVSVMLTSAHTTKSIFLTASMRS